MDSRGEAIRLKVCWAEALGTVVVVTEEGGTRWRRRIATPGRWRWAVWGMALA